MDYYSLYDAPFGVLTIISDGIALKQIIFGQSYINHVSDICQEIFRDTAKWLDIYFTGKDPGFELPYVFDSKSSDFRKEVLEIIKSVGFGELITYGEIACEIAKRRNIKRMSSQAVGGALGKNPIPIFIPCHRVIGRNGLLTGFTGGGLEIKSSLLVNEGHQIINGKVL